MKTREEVKRKIEEYLKENGNGWTYDFLERYYKTYYLSGLYCNPEFLEIVKNNEPECRLLFG